MSHDRLLIFVKAPRVGFVKTRLALEIGPEEACAAYVQMVDTLVANLRHLKCKVELRYSPDDGKTAVTRWQNSNWECRPQGEGDLGARLRLAFQEAFNHNAARVCIIGSDCPYVNPSDIEAGFAALKDHDLVLGPAEDGGYWLIGLNQARPELLDQIEWSSSKVFAQTMDKADSLKLRVRLLRKLPDIDRAEDWMRFQARDQSV